MIRAYLIRVPSNLADQVTEATPQRLDALQRAIEAQGITVEGIEYITTLVTQVEEPVPDEHIRAAVEAKQPMPEPGIKLERDTWPHFRIFADGDPTGTVLAFPWSAALPDDELAKQWKALLAYADEAETGKVTPLQTARALAGVIRILEQRRR